MSQEPEDPRIIGYLERIAQAEGLHLLMCHECGRHFLHEVPNTIICTKCDGTLDKFKNETKHKIGDVIPCEYCRQPMTLTVATQIYHPHCSLIVDNTKEGKEFKKRRREQQQEAMCQV